MMLGNLQTLTRHLTIASCIWVMRVNGACLLCLNESQSQIPCDHNNDTYTGTSRSTQEQHEQTPSFLFLLFCFLVGMVILVSFLIIACVLDGLSQPDAQPILLTKEQREERIAECVVSKTVLNHDDEECANHHDIEACCASTITTVSDNSDTFSREMEPCHICLEPFAAEEHVSWGRCRHVFHADCILAWLHIHDTCPVCREEFLSPKSMTDFKSLSYCIEHGLRGKHVESGGEERRIRRMSILVVANDCNHGDSSLQCVTK